MTDSTNFIPSCNDSLVWDAHAGVFPDPGINLNLLSHWHEQGVNYVSINVGFDVMDWSQTLKTLAVYRRWLVSQQEHFTLVGSVKEIENAKSNGKLAVSFDIEGVNALNGDINMISLYHQLGVRQMLFAYNLNNAAAGGCHDKDTGLTPFGYEIVEEMNRVGLIVDCSHAAYTTTMDIMQASAKPVVFSHSNPTLVCSHERNITDDQIKACAKTDGVIGVNGMGIFVGNNNSSNESLMRHIDYLAELVGTRHIGLGFDYSPKVDIDIGDILKSRPDYWPTGKGYDTPDIQHAAPSQLKDLSELLINAGYNEKDIQGIMGENFKRVAAASWNY